MSRIKNTAEIRTYDEPEKGSVIIKNDACLSDRVIITMGKESRTVIARDLQAALQNCTNVG